MTASWLDEYRFLRAFPGYTHDRYLDENPDVVRWLLEVDAVMSARKAKADDD